MMNHERDLVKGSAVKRSMASIFAGHHAIDDQIISSNDSPAQALHFILGPASVRRKPETVKRVPLEEFLGRADSMIFELQRYCPENRNLFSSEL
jgi:hypothetical protein